MNEEVPKLKKKLNCSPTEAEQLLIAKYIKNYELYDKIYNFYWNTICGKKLKYPMSKFINTLHNQAIRFDYLYGINPDFNYDVQETKFEGIVLYKKAADAKSKYLFYSLIEDALDDQKVKDYRTVL